MGQEEGGGKFLIRKMHCDRSCLFIVLLRKGGLRNGQWHGHAFGGVLSTR
jgi:hypothetical protein